MTIKLRAIDRWLRADETIPLPGGKRIVTVQFNVEERTKLTVFQHRKETLLRVLEPTECPATISFVVEGDCSIVPESDGAVWWQSDDGDILSYEVHGESFTKLEQRMEMTAEMVVTILKSQVRLEQRRAEQAILLLQKQERDAAAAGADPETGEVVEKSLGTDAGTAKPAAVAGDKPAPEPEPAGDSDAPAKPATT